jgi:outer membrane protein OmpA-like peptidoglycan-associated protein
MRPGINHATRAVVGVCLLLLTTCKQSPTPAGGSTPSQTQTNQSAGRAGHQAPSTNADQSPPDILGLTNGGRPLPPGLTVGGECPSVDNADQEIAAQAAARVPLKEGLTLAETWNPTQNEEYECLTQIQKIDRDGIDATMSCNYPKRPEVLRRRVCRSDLRSARMLHTGTGGITTLGASGEELPETIVGATWFSLSQSEFTELKRTGSTRHHYIEYASTDALLREAVGTLRLERQDTLEVPFTDGVVKLPVIRVSGDIERWWGGNGRTRPGRVTAMILDDERFPLLLDYQQTSDSNDPPLFRLQFAKISRKTDGELERHLAVEKRVDVYGIYFDFASDRIRKESEPVLKEIGDALSHNPSWTLSIAGHTDNIGGSPYNLDLSRRRSDAVRKALVERYGVAPGRLTTTGYGDGAPKDTNDTPAGRAKNRRVELVRVAS